MRTRYKYTHTYTCMCVCVRTNVYNGWMWLRWQGEEKKNNHSRTLQSISLREGYSTWDCKTNKKTLFPWNFNHCLSIYLLIYLPVCLCLYVSLSLYIYISIDIIQVGKYPQQALPRTDIRTNRHNQRTDKPTNSDTIKTKCQTDVSSRPERTPGHVYVYLNEINVKIPLQSRVFHEWLENFLPR